MTSSTLRKVDQSQHSIGSSIAQRSQSATSCSVASLSARRPFGIIGQPDIPGATPSAASSSTAVRRPLFESEMPRVKQTKKKPPKEFRCQECNKVFTQRSNYTRHLGLVHEVDEFGNTLPVAERLKLQGYNVKRRTEVQQPKETPAKRKKKTTSVEFLPSSSSSSPDRSAIPAALGRPPSPSEESLFVAADEPEAEDVIEITETDREVDSADEYFVYVGVQDPDAPEAETTEAAEAEATIPVTSVETTIRSGSPLITPETGRRPTRPTKFAGRGRSIRTIIEAPQPLPKAIATARRRTEKISMWRLAKKADDYSQSTADHAESLTKELLLTPQGRQRCLEIMRGIRTGHRQLSTKIRKNLPLNAGRKQRVSFLAWLEATIQRVEGRSSDELPE